MSPSNRRRKHAVRQVLVGAQSGRCVLLHTGGYQRNQGSADARAVLCDANADTLGSLLAHSVDDGQSLITARTELEAALQRREISRRGGTGGREEERKQI